MPIPRKFPTTAVRRLSAPLLGTLAAAALAAAAPFARAADPIKICSIDDRSGAAADTGMQSYNGLQIAIAEVNAAGA